MRGFNTSLKPFKICYLISQPLCILPNRIAYLTQVSLQNLCANLQPSTFLSSSSLSLSSSSTFVSNHHESYNGKYNYPMCKRVVFTSSMEQARENILKVIGGIFFLSLARKIYSEQVDSANGSEIYSCENSEYSSGKTISPLLKCDISDFGYFRSLTSCSVRESTTQTDSITTLQTQSSCESSHNSPLWRSEANRPFERKMEDALIFSGNSNKILARDVADRLSTRLGQVNISRFADGEVNLQFHESLRGKDVYIIQPTSPPVNENLIELLLMISTCRRASAKKITAVIPYYGYARQDRKLSSRVPISAADVARMLEAMGVDRVVAVDLHCGQIQGFFGPRVPVDNLEAQIIGLDYFQQKKLDNVVVISPDAGGVYRARKFQEGLIKRGHSECRIAMLIKQRARVNEIERMDLVGDVKNSDVIIVDDMIDTAGTLCEAARELRNKGAKRIYAFATHGLFSGPAMKRISESPLEEVVVTDSIQIRDEVKKCEKIKTLSISALVADCIRRIHQKESLNDLFHFNR